MESGKDVVPQAQYVPGYTYLRCLVFGLESESARKSCVQALEFTLGSKSLLHRRSDDCMSWRLVLSWAIETRAKFHALLTERRPVSLTRLLCRFTQARYRAVADR